uniref:Uncharacterized protein n=1 Tax=Timema genevievae TaxID=629358 RepID=A0A7R9K629_TIMGE|nr:unnamed protein product [Timema genevievae]
METCDISLVKEEIVEFIETEPQNEAEFDMFGQSGVKTEDSSLTGDLKDTINNEAQRFQTSDVEMKPLWDGFLPIKEQIKDESDTSNSVDEIVKNEIKLYDSFLGIMDSNIVHFTPGDKSEIKLEQDQSSLSRLRLEDIVNHMEGERDVKLKIVLKVLRLEDIALHMEEERNVKLKIVLKLLRLEETVLHMEEDGNVKLKIVQEMLRLEEIVLHMEEDRNEEIALHMEEEGNVKLKIVLKMLRLEDIVSLMEEEGNVKLKIVLKMLRLEDIVSLMEEEGNVKLIIVLKMLRLEDIVFHMEEEGNAHLEVDTKSWSLSSVGFYSCRDVYDVWNLRRDEPNGCMTSDPNNPFISML